MLSMILLASSYTPKYFARIEITKSVHFCTELGRIAAESSKNCCPANRSKMSNIEHSSSGETLQSLGMKTRELTAKQKLSVPCPTCGAATGDACVLHTGALRNQPHRDRKLSAAEAVEMKAPKRQQPARPLPKTRINILRSSEQF
jgi:hypothetical protein